MAINQREIAKILNVSQYTVSVAFGSEGRISEEVRRKVIEAAKKYDYRPNRLASGLRGTTTRTIGIIWNFVDLWAGDTPIAMDMLDRLQGHDYTVYQFQLHPDVEVICRNIDEMLSRNVDAIVMRAIPSQLMNPRLIRLVESAPAVVAVCREDVELFPGDIVVHDRDQAIRQVAGHFAVTGRKRPAMILDMSEESNPSKFKAFQEECLRLGIENHPKMILDMDRPATPEQIGARHTEAIRRHFPGKMDVDAIFSFNDIGAFHVMRELQDRGVRIPEDVAVSGFNDNVLGKLWRPPLATGDRKHHEVAQHVEDLLMKRIRAPGGSPERRVVHMEFIRRESAC
ncbi:MAG TPA: hypothetical protein DCZ94_17330 [Lentisphaeria bacterium]|nr:MAG: hypothetical protein A2X48_20850 [Lentisphaerae bacterium GWF2_49_21]HBC88708.1 hypothetical protein [Lentisphaeria bacterium]